MFQWVSFFSSMLSVLGVCVNVFRFFVFHCHRFFLCNLVASLLSGVCVFCGFAFACQVCFEEGSKCTIISESCASVVIELSNKLRYGCSPSGWSKFPNSLMNFSNSFTWTACLCLIANAEIVVKWWSLFYMKELPGHIFYFHVQILRRCHWKKKFNKW